MLPALIALILISQHGMRYAEALFNLAPSSAHVPSVRHRPLHPSVLPIWIWLGRNSAAQPTSQRTPVFHKFLMMLSPTGLAGATSEGSAMPDNTSAMVEKGEGALDLGRAWPAALKIHQPIS